MGNGYEEMHSSDRENAEIAPKMQIHIVNVNAKLSTFIFSKNLCLQSKLRLSEIVAIYCFIILRY